MSFIFLLQNFGDQLPVWCGSRPLISHEWSHIISITLVHCKGVTQVLTFSYQVRKINAANSDCPDVLFSTIYQNSLYSKMATIYRYTILVENTTQTMKVWFNITAKKSSKKPLKKTYFPLFKKKFCTLKKYNYRGANFVT